MARIRASAVSASGIGPPNDAAVHGEVEDANGDPAVHDAADADVSSVGMPVRQLPPSATTTDVGGEQVAMTVDEERQVLGTRLLLALDDDLQR